MRLFPIALLFLATPAMAQQPPPMPEQQAWQIMYSREVIAHQQDLAAALKQQAQIEALTKERDELKAKLASEPKPPPVASLPPKLVPKPNGE